VHDDMYGEGRLDISSDVAMQDAFLRGVQMQKLSHRPVSLPSRCASSDISAREKGLNPYRRRALFARLQQEATPRGPVFLVGGQC
jgi:hypothetical protein